MHYKTGELFTEYLKGSCADQNGQLCDYCHEHKFVGPVASRIPQPMPDRENPGHYMDVFDTPSMNGDSSRQADDYLPRAQIKIRFREGVLSASNEEAIRAFSTEFAVKVEFVQKYVNHLHHLQCKEEMRQRQRDMARGEREQMEYDDYNWLELVNNGSLSKLVVSELNKYLKKHNLNTTGNKHAKMQIIKRHIQTLGDASMETSDAENVESNIAEEESEDSDHDEQQPLKVKVLMRGRVKPMTRYMVFLDQTQVIVNKRKSLENKL